MNRLSIVGDIYVLAISSASSMHIGNSKLIQPENWVLAVQRRVSVFLGREGNFAAFPLFSKPIPLPAVSEPVTISTDNLGSVLKVGRIVIYGISSSSLLHVGSTQMIDAEARIKNIRQFVTLPGEVPGVGGIPAVSASAGSAGLASEGTASLGDQVKTQQ